MVGEPGAGADFRIGQVLCERWRIDRLLGVGGFAAVYAATHRAGKRVAIKLLRPELAVDPQIRQRFLREAYVANAVEHRGAVSVLDDDVTADGAPFLVMELLEGETVHERRERLGGTLPPNEVLAIGAQVLDVLAAAHDKGIVHRDLKPANLFLTCEGRVRLLDFGIARLRELPSSSHSTLSGTMLGTPAFMAPEQAASRGVDARTDIWSLGATMFMMLTGRLVHGELSPTQMLVAAMTRSAPSLATVAPTCAPQLAAVVDRALAFDMAQRWHDARAMRDAVDEAYRATVGQPLSPERLLIPDVPLPSPVPTPPTWEFPRPAPIIRDEPTAEATPWVDPDAAAPVARAHAASAVEVAPTLPAGGIPASGSLESPAQLPTTTDILRRINARAGRPPAVEVAEAPPRRLTKQARVFALGAAVALGSVALALAARRPPAAPSTTAAEAAAAAAPPASASVVTNGAAATQPGAMAPATAAPSTEEPAGAVMQTEAAATAPGAAAKPASGSQNASAHAAAKPAQARAAPAPTASARDIFDRRQ